MSGAETLADPYAVEPSFLHFEDHGFDWRTANTGLVTTRLQPTSSPHWPLKTLDWLFTRGLQASAPFVAAALSDTRRLSVRSRNDRRNDPAMKTQIVCHRGACRHAPENTIASGLAAARLGGDIVELDVRQSRDGVLYVLHDATVDRTTNGSGPIADLTSTEIDRLDAGTWFGPEFTDEPVPRLDRFFHVLKAQVGFYVEVKTADADAVADAIRKRRN